MGFPLATSPPSLAGIRFQSITAAEPSLRRVAMIGPGSVGSRESPSLCSNANACSDGRAIPHWSSMPNVPLKIPLGTPPSSKTLLNVQYDIASASPMQFLMVSVMKAGFCELQHVRRRDVGIEPDRMTGKASGPASVKRVSRVARVDGTGHEQSLTGYDGLVGAGRTLSYAADAGRKV